MRTLALPLTAVAVALGLSACGNSGSTEAATAETTTDPGMAGAADMTGSGNMAGATTGGPAATGSGAASHNQVGTSGASGTVATTTSDPASETNSGPTTPGETSGKAPIEQN